MIRRLLNRIAGLGKTPRHRALFRAALLLTTLAVGGFLLAASGLIPIKASSGHWPMTRWFLNFAKKRSLDTHTLGLKPPALDDPSLVLRGAAHYETGCRPCHGSPAQPQPRMALLMTPPAPFLPSLISQRESRELFYVVKHGIKFTGMPAWPAQQRDDEVWAVVAFLRRLPELEAPVYRRLVSGESVPRERPPLEALLTSEKVSQVIAESCVRCHGVDGLGRGVAFPKLAGQKVGYLHASLQAYARGQRHSGFMEPVASSLSAESLEELARYYANLVEVGTVPSPISSLTPENSQANERGKVIANVGIPSQRVPACVACHGPSPTRHNAVYPMLAGQHADYLVRQLQLFEQGHRGGTDYAHLMHFVAGRLTPEQKRDVALYYASLAWARDQAPP